jgi:hypothetical protein
MEDMEAAGLEHCLYSAQDHFGDRAWLCIGDILFPAPSPSWSSVTEEHLKSFERMQNIARDCFCAERRNSL